MSCALTALLTNGLISSELSDSVGRAAEKRSPPQGDIKVNAGEKHCNGNTAVIGSGAGLSWNSSHLSRRLSFLIRGKDRTQPEISSLTPR